MPNKKLSMSRIKQVLRCYAAGKGTRSIADLLDISMNTVSKYLSQVIEARPDPGQASKSCKGILSLG